MAWHERDSRAHTTGCCPACKSRDIGYRSLPLDPDEDEDGYTRCCFFCASEWTEDGTLTLDARHSLKNDYETQAELDEAVAEWDIQHNAQATKHHGEVVE